MQQRTSANLLGIDVSLWQGTINWQQVKNDISRVAFAYAKCTEDTTFFDPQFVANAQGARAVGIPVGAYHFARPSTAVGSAEAQCDYFIQQMQVGFGANDFGDIFPVIDVESPFPRNDAVMTTTQLLNWIVTFRDRFKARTGRTLMLYTGNYFIEDYQNFNYPSPGNPLLDMPLWVANYVQNPPPDSGGWTQWRIWQYTDSGTIAGITGPVDEDAGPYTIDALKDDITPPVTGGVTSPELDLYVLNSSEQLLTALSNRGDACPFYGAVHVEQLNGENYLEFSIPADHAAASNVVEGNLVYYRDLDNRNQVQLFEIMRVEENHKGELLKDVYAQHKVFELIDDWSNNLNLFGVTAASALSQILNGTRWNVGVVEVAGTSNVPMVRMNSMEGVQLILSRFGGELRFRVEFSGATILTKYIDILTRRGAETGKRFEYGRDVAEIKRTVDMTQLVTRAAGYGAGDPPLTFASVAWTKPPNPANKPAGAILVSDPDALAAWGRYGGTFHRTGHYINTQQTDPAQLLQETWNYVQANNRPFVSYEMTVADLEFISGLSHEKVRLGDTVAIIDRLFNPELRTTARIVEIRRNLAEPEKTRLTINNILPIIGGL